MKIDYPDAGACTDLNVYVYVTVGEDGADLAEVHLDGHLAALLDDVDGDDLKPDVAALAHGALREALRRLDRVLRENLPVCLGR